MKGLINKLTDLHKEYNVIGIKQSTEDEGAKYNDILTMRRITELCGLNLNVKIGGCEAKNDIDFCHSISADGIVAPMVESKFALQKFIESVTHLPSGKFYINIESKTAYENLDSILNSPSSKLLSGIIIGRSDLTKSYGLEKDDVDSQQIDDAVYDILRKCKESDITTLMGGNISPQSGEFIKKLYNKKLLDKIETRNVMFKLNNKNINNLEEAIKKALDFEILWLREKSSYYMGIGNSYLDRATVLNGRA